MRIAVSCEDVQTFRDILEKVPKGVKLTEVEDGFDDLKVVFDKPFRRRDSKAIFDVLDNLSSTSARYNITLVEK